MSAAWLMLGLLVVLGTLVFVLVPLFQPSGPREPEPEENARAEWLRRRDESYAAINDTELDYEMGKLSLDDYRAMRARYEGQAIEALAALDEPAGRGGGKRAKRRCARCGAPVRGGGFCGDCGARLVRSRSNGGGV